MRKIIFLDIDGVLNGELWFSQIAKAEKPKDKHQKDWEDRFFDPRCITLLNQLVSDTEAFVVISSTWRKTRTLDDLKDILKRNGFLHSHKIIGKTPVLTYTTVTNTVPRGAEIKVWLEQNKSFLGTKLHLYDKYLILDDDSDMLFWQRENYFRVDGYSGLTPSLVYRATNFLNR